MAAGAVSPVNGAGGGGGFAACYRYDTTRGDGKEPRRTPSRSGPAARGPFRRSSSELPGAGKTVCKAEV